MDPHQAMSMEGVCRLTGLEPSQVRFLEAEFSAYLGDDRATPRSQFLPDQVTLLRRIQRDLFSDGLSIQDVHRSLKQPVDLESSRPATIWAVTSGKGGVGKTTVSIQLALAAARLGLRTILVDADLGLGNVRIQCGLPGGRSLADVLLGTARLEEALQDGPGGIRVVGNVSGESRVADIAPTRIRGLASALRLGSLDADLILLDTGAGIATQVLSFLGLADETLLITTPDVSAMLDGYGVLKAARQAGVTSPFHLLVNLVEPGDNPDLVYARVHACADRYLQSAPSYLGFLPRHPALTRTARDRNPGALWAASDPVTTRFLDLVSRFHPTTQPAPTADPLDAQPAPLP